MHVVVEDTEVVFGLQTLRDEPHYHHVNRTRQFTQMTLIRLRPVVGGRARLKIMQGDYCAALS